MPVCGYKLRGVTQPRGPECGKRLALSVVAPDLSMQAWALLTFVTCLVAGPGVISLACLVFFAARGAPAGMPDGVYVAMAFVSLAVPASVLLLVFRVRFLRLPPGRQHLIAAIGCVAWIGGILAIVLAGLA